MYKNYQCPQCKTWESYPLASAPFLQPYCKTLNCNGRLNYENTTPGPRPPSPPPVLTPGDIDFATRPLTVHRDGTFCTYDVLQDRRSLRITFTGTNKATGKIYNLDLSAMGKQYEIPAYADIDNPTSGIFILNSKGEVDWEPGPTRLPRCTGPAPQRKILSMGHEANLFSSPLRVQLGAQNENDQHSGSGLIHLMFSHDRDSLMGVQQLIRQLLFPLTNIKAIYKTKTLHFGYHRYSILAGGTADFPFEIIVEGQATFLRLLTIYKATVALKSYNKFKSHPADWARLYSANTEIY